MPLTPRYFISPTEPKELRSIGHTTLYPETLGCDVVAVCFQPSMRLGFQRKEVKDFLASLNDGRLQKELGQIKSSGLQETLLILEGTWFWTTEGTLGNGQYGLSNGYTRRGHRNLLVRIQSMGIHVVETDSISDTCQAIQTITAYLSKTTHGTLDRRPKGHVTSWGKVTNESFASHLLQSFPGIGPETARSIYTKFNKAPLAWECTVEDLMSIDGIGRKTAMRLIESLNG